MFGKRTKRINYEVAQALGLQKLDPGYMYQRYESNLVQQKETVRPITDMAIRAMRDYLRDGDYAVNMNDVLKPHLDAFSEAVQTPIEMTTFGGNRDDIMITLADPKTGKSYDIRYKAD